MFEIIFAYRADMRAVISTNDVIAATRYIISGVRSSNTKYLDRISEVIRPMSTLFVGLHCNIEEVFAHNKNWSEYFLDYHTDHEAIELDIKWIKRLDTNFVRVCLMLEGIV